MNYIKSSGFFSLFYVFLYFCASMGLGIFISDSEVFTSVFYVILLLYVFIYIRICGEKTKQTLRIRPIHIGSFFLILLLSFTIRPMAGFITQIANLFFQDITSSAITQKVQTNLMLSLFTTALLPGIVEEFLFRGTLYSRMRKANPIKGILLTSLFFGIAHMNFQQFTYAFFLGIVFGLLIEATDSIVSSVTAHIAFNGTSLILTSLLAKTGQMTGSSTGSTGSELASLAISLPIAAISLIFSIILLILIAKLNGRLGYMKTWLSKDIRKTWPREKAANISFFVALGICFAFSILMELVNLLL